MKVNFHFSFIPAFSESFPPNYLNESLLKDALYELSSKCESYGAIMHGELSHSDWDIIEEPYTCKKLYSITFQAEVEGMEDDKVYFPLEIYLQ